MKSIELIGNVGRNAEKITTAGGREMMRFSLAVSNRNAETIWFSVLANHREKIFPYIVKGKQLFVSGDFDLRLYNGQPTLDVFADKIELIGAKVETNASAVTNEVSTPQAPTEETEVTF